VSSASFGGALDLEKEANNNVGAVLSVNDQIKLDDQRLRRWVGTRIVRVFIAANILTLLAIGSLAGLDQHNLEHSFIMPADRIITHQVIIALPGATTVQVGAITMFIARNLFPTRFGLQ
jgi:hypothetical protein